LIWIWRPARCAAVAPCATASALGSSAALPCASWPPFFRHCVGGGKRADALRRRSRARPCDLHPGVGDHAHPASLQAGVCPTSHCSCSLSPRDLCVRRSPHQREPIGAVRAAAVSFVPSWLAIAFEIAPPVPRPSNRETRASSASPILICMSRPPMTVPRLAAYRCGNQLLPVSDAGTPQGVFRDELRRGWR